MPEPGPAIFIDAEDDEKEIHIRLSSIARHYGVTYSELHRDGLHFMSLLVATPSWHVSIEAARSNDAGSTIGY